MKQMALTLLTLHLIKKQKYYEKLYNQSNKYFNECIEKEYTHLITISNLKFWK